VNPSRTLLGNVQVTFDERTVDNKFCRWRRFLLLANLHPHASEVCAVRQTGCTPIEVGPGQALCIPRGAVHRFDNLGNEDVKQLAVISPAIMGPAYFREAAEVIDAAVGGPPDRAKMMEVFRRHGMTLAAPPPVK
jgi:hypothetical protein